MINERPPYLSPSSMSTFEQCPLKYKYTRIDKMPEPPTRATLIGNFVHEVLENFYVLQHDERNTANLKSLSGKVWEESEWLSRVEPILASSIEVKNGKSTIDEELRMFRWQSWWCLENLFNMEDPTTITPTGIEYEINGEINGVPIKGFVDRWSESENGLVVSDYKTGKAPNPRYAKDKFVQLLIYAIYITEQTQKPIDKLELLFLKDQKLFTHRPTSEDIKATKVRIKGVWDGITERCTTGEWEPVPHRLCDWCNFKNTICPYWNKK